MTANLSATGAGIRPENKGDPPTASAGIAINLVSQMAFGLLCMTICLPSMQEWPAIFSASQASIQLTFSLYLLTYGGFQLLFGPLSDRYGRRRLLMLGLVLAFFGLLLAALAPNIETLIAARALQGAGCAGCMVICRAAVQDFFAGARRTRMMAFVGMAMGLCPPIATVVGGQMHVHLGWQSNFVMLAVLSLLLMVAAWHYMPANASGAQQNRQAGLSANSALPMAPIRPHWLREMGQSYRRLGREPAFLWNVTILGATSAAFYAFLGGAPTVLGNYGIGPGQVGFFIMMTPLSYIVGNYLSTHVVRYRGESWMRMAGLWITLLGIVLVMGLALLGVRSPFAFSVPLTLMGIGHGLLIPPTLSATVGLVPALAGAAAAVSGVAQQVLGALGGYLVGWVLLDTPLHLALLMMFFTSMAILAETALRRSPA